MISHFRRARPRSDGRRRRIRRGGPRRGLGVAELDLSARL